MGKCVAVRLLCFALITAGGDYCSVYMVTVPDRQQGPSQGRHAQASPRFQPQRLGYRGRSGTEKNTDK